MRSKITATRIGLRKPIAAAIAAVMLGQAPLADAAIFKELSKEALAEMRGKFVVGPHIQYFGMSVTTTWERAVADGGHRVSMNLQVDNSGPETRVSYQIGGTLGEDL